MKRIDRTSLVTWSTAMFQLVGLSLQESKLIAGYLAEADERGHPSHGTDQLPSYVRGFREGHLNISPTIAVVRKRGALAVVDGDNGLGHVVANFSMNLAVELAREHGLAIVNVRNSNHFGMAGHWPLIAIRSKMIGFATTNGPPVMAPWGGRSGAICNNPFSWGVPAGEEVPLLLDMALTAGARGKVRLAEQQGEVIPQGWALDRDGKPTTDPKAALDGVMLPFGEHKGSAMAIVHEVLATAMSNSHFLNQITSITMASSGVHVSWKIGHMFMVIDPSVLRPIDEFTDHVDQIIRQLRKTLPSIGSSGVQIPGEGSARRALDALRMGIPITPTSIMKLTNFGIECGIPFPTSKLTGPG